MKISRIKLLLFICFSNISFSDRNSDSDDVFGWNDFDTLYSFDSDNDTSTPSLTYTGICNKQGKWIGADDKKLDEPLCDRT